MLVTVTGRSSARPCPFYRLTILINRSMPRPYVAWHRWHRGAWQQRREHDQVTNRTRTYVRRIWLGITHLTSVFVVRADGIEEYGGSIMYKANVRRILTEGQGDQLRAVGVQLADGRTFKGQVSLSMPVLCCAAMCCAVLCCVVPCCVVLCCVALRCGVLCWRLFLVLVNCFLLCFGACLLSHVADHNFNPMR